MKNALPLLALLALSALIVGCSSAPSKNETGWIGYTEKGEASFYADKHQFKRTASGELYDHNLKTAAHRTIPLGSTINVTNIANGKSVIAKVNDRGPYAENRIVDLSKAAFSSIADTASGVITVQIEVIE